MTPLLPLAAGDWGDLIFLIVVMAGGLIQWVMGLRKKNRQPEEADSRNPTPSSWETNERSEQAPAGEPADPSWDDLMDALGQKPGEVPPPIPQPEPKPHVLPPPAPLVVRSAQTRDHLSTPFGTLEEQQPAVPELSDHLKTLLSSMEKPRSMAQAGIALSPVQKTSDIPTVTGNTKTPLGRMVRERGQLRRAIILQEILQPPLALR